MRKSVSLVVLVVSILMVGLVPATAQEPMHMVSGRVFLDANRNGVWDAGEGPVDADGPAVVVAGRYRAQVAADGTYQLRLPAGTHRIRVTVVSRSRLVSTTNPFVQVSIPPDRAEVNFGFAICQAESKKPVLPMLPRVRLPMKKMVTPHEPELVKP
jgi:hypothetical protein